MLNRKQAPAFKTIEKINVLRAKPHKLNNGLSVFTLSEGSQEITKLEFIFKAGMYYQPAALIASTTNALLEGGTKSYTASQLSSGIDFYGSFLELEVDQDFSSVNLFSLNRYLTQSLNYLEEIIKYPVFPENEFKIHVENKKQRHTINSQKVNVLARRRFSELLFGDLHPYGIDVKESDFERVNVQEIQRFFNAHYNLQNCTIIASGKLPENIIETLNEFFGNDSLPAIAPQQPGFIAPQGVGGQKHYLHKPDAIQSAIKVGRIMFNKTHPDYFNFQVLNTVLGGYFGSRLMTNIREDKGYTYGIGSGLSSFINAGYFFISTEVGADFTNQTLSEIYKELKKLREELIDSTELETVRNYILGHFLRSVDGPFSLADKFKAIWEFGLSYEFYDNYFEAVKSVTPAQLRELANNYLQEKDLIECVVGKM